VAYEKKCKIMRNVASIAGLKKSFFAETDKVENCEGLKKLRVKYLGREKGILKGVSREYLHKSGYGLGFCPVEAIAD
jgi:hypothetical protein